MPGVLASLESDFQTVLNLTAEDLLAVRYVMCLSFVNTWHADPEPVWGYLVGPPGTGKTELLRTLEGWARSLVVDELTENALASGSPSEEGQDTSLLPHLDGKVLVIKDFSTVTGQNLTVLTKTLSVLRSAYDGSYGKHSGKQGFRHYQCKFGILAATTPVIDSFLASSQKLGERFLMFRMLRRGLGDRHARTAMLRHVRSRMADKSIWRAQLRLRMQQALSETRSRCEAVNPKSVTVPDLLGEVIDNLADLTARLRTAPLDGTPNEPEAANRIVQQLANLAKAQAICDGRRQVDDSDLALLRRVAFDTLPRPCALLVRILLQAPLTLSQLAARSHLPADLVNATTQQYLHTGLLTVESDHGRLQLSEDTMAQLNLTGLTEEVRRG